MTYTSLDANRIRLVDIATMSIDINLIIQQAFQRMELRKNQEATQLHGKIFFIWNHMCVLLVHFISKALSTNNWHKICENIFSKNEVLLQTVKTQKVRV